LLPKRPVNAGLLRNDCGLPVVRVEASGNGPLPKLMKASAGAEEEADWLAGGIRLARARGLRAQGDRGLTLGPGRAGHRIGDLESRPAEVDRRVRLSCSQEQRGFLWCPAAGDATDRDIAAGRGAGAGPVAGQVLGGDRYARGRGRGRDGLGEDERGGRRGLLLGGRKSENSARFGSTRPGSRRPGFPSSARPRQRFSPADIANLCSWPWERRLPGELCRDGG